MPTKTKEDEPVISKSGSSKTIIQEIINYLNINYSEHQNSIGERIEFIDKLIHKLNTTNDLLLEIYKIRDPERDDLYNKICYELEDLGLNFYISNIFSVDGDDYDDEDELYDETFEVVIIWLCIPELLNYIPEKLYNWSWFNTNLIAINTLKKIKEELLNK